MATIVSGDVWDDVAMLDFSQRDAQGRDRRVYLGALDWEERGQLLGMRRDSEDGTPNVVGLRSTGEVTPLTIGDVWRIPVERFTGNDKGTLEAVSPKIGDEYNVQLLLPDLLIGVASTRRPDFFWLEVSETIASILPPPDETVRWPSELAAIAHALTPGQTKIGDRVALFRGGTYSVRAWDGTNWVAFTDGHTPGEILLVQSILAKHIAGSQINADHLAADSVTAVAVRAGEVIVKNDLMLDNGVIRFRHLHDSLLGDIGTAADWTIDSVGVSSFPSGYMEVTEPATDLVVRRDAADEEIRASLFVDSGTIGFSATAVHGDVSLGPIQYVHADVSYRDVSLTRRVYLVFELEIRMRFGASYADSAVFHSGTIRVVRNLAGSRTIEQALTGSTSEWLSLAGRQRPETSLNEIMKDFEGLLASRTVSGSASITAQTLVDDMVVGAVLTPLILQRRVYADWRVTNVEATFYGAAWPTFALVDGRTSLGNLPSGVGDGESLALLAGWAYVADDSGNELWRFLAVDPSAATNRGTLPFDGPTGLTAHGSNLLGVSWYTGRVYQINLANPAASTLLGTIPLGHQPHRLGV